MIRLVTASLTLLCLLVPPLAARGADAKIPFEPAAREFVTRLGLDAAQAEKLKLEDLLAKGFVHGRFGLFEVQVPASALAANAEKLKRSTAAVVDGLGQWLEWLAPLDVDSKAIRADQKLLAEWVRGWKVATLAKAEGVGGKDLLEILAAPEPVVQASKRFGDAVAKGEPLGVTLAAARPIRLYLLPTRADFVGFLSWVGLAWPADRAKFWVDGLGDWTQCFVGDDQAVALEYAAPNRKDGDYTTAIDMNERHPTTMEQQVVQLAMNSLFDHFYAGRVPPSFTQGLSMNLVIEQFGEITTRVDGDVRSRTMGAREVFVPGGMDNGSLPPNSAESPWRVDLGKDYFIRVLRLSQKDGDDLDKKTRNRSRCFRVLAEDQVERVAVVAPFLGTAAAKTVVPPAEFMPDFEELMRAYKSGFMHWLRTKSGGNENNSHARFARLLAALADPKRTGGFEAVFLELYDKAPLSGPELDKTSLEGRFLLWLTK